ncbi:hypothetical protein GH714_035501 [Hevea brasiliensis]|uniref:Uncharacterized protein n=1 Tax=Hevea brasiliensis TaxID=3981 RepID=A0A6A6M372_HEVBR|nr:hypothetical protein GH714_035501 [Hevea brasiliensis]
MAGSRPSSVSSQSSSQAFTSRLLLLLTLLPLTLAAFAFVLQWRGGLTDPVSRWSPDHHEFPGMETTSSSTASSRTKDSGCTDLLGRSHYPSFPYYRNWKFDFGSDLKPKICITTSTSAGLDQTLPWIFYHKVIGVSSFFLFVEGKATSPNVSKVLETIPESSVERDDVKEPFSEVSLFKKNYDHLPKDVYFGNYTNNSFGNPNYFLTYGNGKSAARIQDHLRPNGAHRWHNYMKTPKHDRIYFDYVQIVVLSLSLEGQGLYMDFDIYLFSESIMTREAFKLGKHLNLFMCKLGSEIKLDELLFCITHTQNFRFDFKTDRCGCKPTKDDVKDVLCWNLTELYRERVVWTDKSLNIKLMRKGILTRIYAPMVIVQGLRESGVFSNVIAMSQTNLTEFLSSVENSDSSKAAKSVVISSRKIGQNGQSQATARRVLQISNNASFPSAVPPESPPCHEDIQVEIC